MKSNLIIFTITFFTIFGCSSNQTINKNQGTDFHVHVYTPNESEEMSFGVGRARMAIDSIDIQRAIIISKAYNKSNSYKQALKENDYVLSEQRKKPNNYAAACGISVKKEWAIKEIRRCHTEGAHVIKLHLVENDINLLFENDFNKVTKILDEIEKLNLTVLIHAHHFGKFQKQVPKFVELINKYKNIRWIIGHLLGRDFKELKNITNSSAYIEISVTPIWMKTKEQQSDLLSTMKNFGMDKFIFGSDWPIIHPAETQKALMNIGLTQSEINQIKYVNAQKFNYLFKK